MSLRVYLEWREKKKKSERLCKISAVLSSTSLACAPISNKIEVHRISSLGREFAEAFTGQARYICSPWKWLRILLQASSTSRPSVRIRAQPTHSAMSYLPKKGCRIASRSDHAILWVICGSQRSCPHCALTSPSFNPRFALEPHPLRKPRTVSIILVPAAGPAQSCERASVRGARRAGDAPHRTPEKPVLVFANCRARTHSLVDLRL
ncbi:hypothetical protein N657DRAFT_642849 [Parathielavia appendiculata]|uniref:Uncharacterized protein n=1 Tax=Parathielavia appendiculata TaxID=2587402 RepID=A0AAN6Z559_9PEZI|nr:hypothetical protein N657DRAFT_642849 [Parathielavia appendiculata]